MTKEELAMAIAKSGKTRTELARRLKVTDRTLYRWLSGTSKIPDHIKRKAERGF